MTEPARVDVSVTPIMRNGVVVGAAAGGHVVEVPCRVAEHVPWLAWTSDRMGGAVARHRGRIFGVVPTLRGFVLTIDTVGHNATRSDVYHAPDLPSVAEFVREVTR